MWRNGLGLSDQPIRCQCSNEMFWTVMAISPGNNKNLEHILHANPIKTKAGDASCIWSYAHCQIQHMNDPESKMIKLSLKKRQANYNWCQFLNPPFHPPLYPPFHPSTHPSTPGYPWSPLEPRFPSHPSTPRSTPGPQSPITMGGRDNEV